MPEQNYSLKDYFGGSDTEGYIKYKEGQSSGQWADLPSYIAAGGGAGGMPQQANLNNVPSALDFATGLEGGIQGSMDALIAKMEGQPNPLDVYTQLEEAAGLPGMTGAANTLREQLYGVEDTIKRVAPTIAATTRESMVTEGQRERMEVTQKAPLLERLAELGTGLGRVEEGIAAARDDLANKVNLYLQGQQMELEPLRLQYQSLVDQAARLTTAFGIDASNQLDVYLMNVRRGWDLSDQEREEAFSLIQTESSYRQELQKAAASAGISLTGNESNDDILAMIGETAAEEIQYERDKKLRALGDAADTGDDLFEDSTTTPTNWWEDYLT